MSDRASNDALQLSKSKVDRAGADLVKAKAAGSPEPLQASEVIDGWRQLHADAMEWVYRSVRGRAEGIGTKLWIAQRLKRKPQIVAKLSRSTTRLSQMQDIAGCRILLPDTQAVDAARVRVEARTGGAYLVDDVDDYRVDGRPDTGYRALHLKLIRDGRFVELQLRTTLQHAWAEAVERAGERTGFALKSGEGPDEILSFFRLASDAFAHVENGNRVPPTTRAMLRKGLARVRAYMPAESGPVPTARLPELSFSTRSNNWCIIYNWRAGRFEYWIDLGTDAEVAAEAYGEYERRYPFDDGYEVVIIGADSAETLKHTHAHYFGSTPNDLDPDGHFSRIL